VIAAKGSGQAAFRRWPIDADRRGPINRAVFEAQANALPITNLKTCCRIDKIVVAFRKAFNNDSYLQAVTVGTGDANRVA
jgi:hypothetical protein